MKQKYILIILIIISVIEAFSCTIGVASNSITSSNKPMLWKSRDISPATINTIRYVENMTYKFVGVATPNEARIWMGVNEMGFALANSLSYDLTVDTGTFYNGNLIHNALGLVANLDDFEDYLDFITTTDAFNLELRGNFVAFDAQGNSKLYEINNDNYWVFDTNAVDSPFILRTNHSVNGGGTEGIERLVRSTEIIQDLVTNNELSVPNILLNQIRDASDSQSEPFQLPWQFSDNTPLYNTDYSICRRNTISAVVIEGVEEGQDPKLTTMWLIMGNPFVTYAIPLLPSVKPYLEPINNLSENSPELTSILWNQENDYLLDTSHFVNSDNFSLLQTFSDRETEAYQAMEIIKTQWEDEEISNTVVKEFIDQHVATALDFSSELFYNFTPNTDSEVEPVPELKLYPNPFKTKLTIETGTSKYDNNQMKVYNLKGQLVKSLEKNNGHYSWDGRNNQNEKLADGIYLVRYDSDNESVTRKVVLLK